MTAGGRAVLVIGGGAHGLIAATLAARAGLETTILEARDEPGGLASAGAIDGLYALDPTLLRALRLEHHGLRFVQRDLALTGLGEGGRTLVLGRPLHETARGIAVWSKSDGEAWLRQMPKLVQRTRDLRRLWWHGLMPKGIRARRLAWYEAVSAAALLDSLFESDTLKAALAFDATVGGLSVLEPGSALALLWHMAQDMCGLQGGYAMPEGGGTGLIAALKGAALQSGVRIRTGARVIRIAGENGAVAGVELAGGEWIAAPFVLSSLSRQRTLVGLCGPAAGFEAIEHSEPIPAPAGTARLTLALHSLPPLDVGRPLESCRFIAVDRVETYAMARDAARRGVLAEELPFQVIFSSLQPDGSAFLHCLIRPLPLHPEGGWESLRMRLIEIILPALDRFIPGLPSRIHDVNLATPDLWPSRFGHDEEPVTLTRLTQGIAAAIHTPLRGLRLCGASAEPVSAMSGRAARIAVADILKEVTR